MARTCELATLLLCMGPVLAAAEAAEEVRRAMGSTAAEAAEEARRAMGSLAAETAEELEEVRLRLVVAGRTTRARLRLRR